MSSEKRIKKNTSARMKTSRWKPLQKQKVCCSTQKLQRRTGAKNIAALPLLKRTIGSTDVSGKDHIDTLAAYKAYLWNNKDIDPHEIRSIRESILNHFARGESVIDKRKRLTKMLAIPYFRRIDFQ